MQTPEFPSLSAMLADHSIGLRKLAEDLARPFEVMKQQQQDISAMLEAIGRGFEQIYPQMEAAVDRLAALGWTMPMEVTPRTLVLLADAAYSDNDVETTLANVYMDDDFKQLRSVERDLLTSPELVRWAGLLGEAFAVFYSGFHQVPIPMLLAITEGVIASETGNLASHSVKVRQMAKKREANATPRTFDYLIWRSASRYLDQLFDNSDFSQSPPTRRNRHWILHGRDAGPWTEIDAVRFVCSPAHHIVRALTPDHSLRSALFRQRLRLSYGNGRATSCSIYIQADRL